MSKETEDALRDWENENRDTGDDVHKHFDDVALRYDYDISAEGRRIYGLMFGQEIEADSPIDDLLAGVAAAAAAGAFAAVADALNVDAFALQCAVGDWYEVPQDKWPEPIGIEALMKLIADCSPKP